MHDDGPALLAATDAQGLEGVVAKRDDSRYEPGARVRTWRKVKVRRHQEVVVGGWLPGRGQPVRAHRRAARGRARPRPATAGRCATPAGSAPASPSRSWPGWPSGSARSPPTSAPSTPRRRGPTCARGATWLRPELVAEVAYGEWTGDHRLRHPSYLGLRHDKDAVDVTRDP